MDASRIATLDTTGCRGSATRSAVEVQDYANVIGGDEYDAGEVRGRIDPISGYRVSTRSTVGRQCLSDSSTDTGITVGAQIDR